ncbi:acyltransferase family protein [Occallatibacter riparius]|uniref:Acyltransferase n=1 Tax=Occallatibacter riparius TaxID=1002689 RepID=A0A9J7BN97_9BACT|nr:acyltransferase [Occallatibacter riparius]UWZ84095.1 acyltransferase [Occallatibacter riparius]
MTTGEQREGLDREPAPSLHDDLVGTPTPSRPARPTWLPSYIPELQGLRGIAVLLVVLYHSHPRFQRTPFYSASLWGWTGVNLFFVLSGFLITSILLESREKPHYFRNFYARRALRIWPVYLLALAVCYLKADWFVGMPVAQAIRTAPWWAYLLFIQNLFHLDLPAGLGPTWSLAIEEQYYLLWAPLVRVLRKPWMLAGALATALIASPLFRTTHFVWITKTHTLTHLDGIAMGSLLALGLYTVAWGRRTWLILGLCAIVIGFTLAGTVAGGTAFLDSALTCGFGGAVLSSIAATGFRNPVNALLRRGPLPFYGRISYGMYMTHIMVFIYYGWFDARMDAYGTLGDLAVVAFRLAVCTAVATILWYGFESRILKLKRYFER